MTTAFVKKVILPIVVFVVAQNRQVNNGGKRITITCVGLTPPAGTTFVKMADDGFLQKFG